MEKLFEMDSYGRNSDGTFDKLTISEIVVSTGEYVYIIETEDDMVFANLDGLNKLSDFIQSLNPKPPTSGAIQ